MLNNVLMKKIIVHNFIILDDLYRKKASLQALIQWIVEGKICVGKF